METPCLVVRESDAVHRYVAGTLSAEEVAEFELHLLECGQCQAAVREGIAVSVALRDVNPAPAAGVDRSAWWVSVAAVAAVTAAIILWPPGTLERLGAVDQPPVFHGMSVRTDADEAGGLADRGMEAYGEGEWARAAELLGSALALDPAPALYFYRGVSLLMAGDEEAAAPALTAALDPPDGPYAAEARLYLAKALLRQGRGEEALVHLGVAATGPLGGGGTEIVRHAAALADSVRQVLDR